MVGACIGLDSNQKRTSRVDLPMKPDMSRDRDHCGIRAFIVFDRMLITIDLLETAFRVSAICIAD